LQRSESSLDTGKVLSLQTTGRSDDDERKRWKWMRKFLPLFALCIIYDNFFRTKSEDLTFFALMRDHSNCRHLNLKAWPPKLLLPQFKKVIVFLLCIIGCLLNHHC